MSVELMTAKESRLKAIENERQHLFAAIEKAVAKGKHSLVLWKGHGTGAPHSKTIEELQGKGFKCKWAHLQGGWRWTVKW